MGCLDASGPIRPRREIGDSQSGNGRTFANLKQLSNAQWRVFYRFVGHKESSSEYVHQPIKQHKSWHHNTYVHPGCLGNIYFVQKAINPWSSPIRCQSSHPSSTRQALLHPCVATLLAPGQRRCGLVWAGVHAGMKSAGQE